MTKRFGIFERLLIKGGLAFLLERRELNVKK
jgi:hypothetical protein